MPTRDFVSPNPFKLAEWGMMGLVGLSGAALVWALLAPTGEGDRPGIASADASPASFAAFDPFFRLNGGGPSVITPLDLSLHGVRADQASGRGSAIIGLPDGTQNSYAVGEEILPGVKLTAVDFDSVTIDRAGAPEKIYLDQSQEASAPGAMPVPAAPPAAPVPSGAASLMADLSLSPRIDGGRITGYLIQQQGDGRALAAAGLQPGDILTSINGVSVSDPGATTRFAESTQAGTPVTVVVVRNGESRTLQIGGAK
ncbi:type II secretion system protein N [Sphingomonas crocodyli]|uniref:PDZ domain-containing protein n=1 Tax=Sphingomonas crocodyli TaxID=1979270 RepID=A0A437M814_9SPHN|nr:type II secretion system protein N [Sphingomonas crocodyli]RVT93850.1 PDZ domain-containing protein [Sphingomonas crocodyli]